MVARRNSGKGQQGADTDFVADESRRKELRYRLAGLLHQEKFDQALDEALAARRKKEILAVDFEFVISIVKGAARLGRVTIERERYPSEAFPDLASASPLAPTPPGPQPQDPQPL